MARVLRAVTTSARAWFEKHCVLSTAEQATDCYNFLILSTQLICVVSVSFEIITLQVNYWFDSLPGNYPHAPKPTLQLSWP